MSNTMMISSVLQIALLHTMTDIDSITYIYYQPLLRW